MIQQQKYITEDQKSQLTQTNSYKVLSLFNLTQQQKNCETN